MERMERRVTRYEVTGCDQGRDVQSHQVSVAVRDLNGRKKKKKAAAASTGCPSLMFQITPTPTPTQTDTHT